MKSWDNLSVDYGDDFDEDPTVPDGKASPYRSGCYPAFKPYGLVMRTIGAVGWYAGVAVMGLSVAGFAALAGYGAYALLTQ